jgi:hypothetical protein
VRVAGGGAQRFQNAATGVESIGDRASERWTVCEQLEGQLASERGRVGRLEDVNRGDVGALAGADRHGGVGNRRLARASRTGEHGVHTPQQRHRHSVDIVLAADHRIRGEGMVGREQRRAGDPASITHHALTYHLVRDTAGKS